MLLFVFLIYYKRKILRAEFTKTRTYWVHTPVGAFQERNGQDRESPLMGRKSRGEDGDIQEALQVNLRSENQILQVNMGFCVHNNNTGNSCLACSNSSFVVWTCTRLITGRKIQGSVTLNPASQDIARKQFNLMSCARVLPGICLFVLSVPSKPYACHVGG